VAPLGLKAAVIEMIDREAELARQTGRGRIVAKMNSLADSEVIKALYRASQAGVQVDLIVRGICCLRPGLPGVSERIRVVSVVDRFLEHSRIWFFEAGGKREMWLSSADWMPRNFIRRVEVAFPIEDSSLKDRIGEEILGTQLLDNVKSRFLHPDGHYEADPAGSYGTPTTPVRSQERLITLARRGTAPAEQRWWPGMRCFLPGSAGRRGGAGSACDPPAVARSGAVVVPALETCAPGVTPPCLGAGRGRSLGGARRAWSIPPRRASWSGTTRPGRPWEWRRRYPAALVIVNGSFYSKDGAGHPPHLRARRGRQTGAGCGFASGRTRSSSPPSRGRRPTLHRPGW